MGKKQKFCKNCDGFLDCGDVPLFIAKPSWCYGFKECGVPR